MTLLGAQLATDEILSLLSQYTLGQPRNILNFKAGSRRVPKAIIETELGKFFLKKHPSTPSKLAKIKLAHQVESFLYEQDFPVPAIILANDGKSYQTRDNHAYEIFEFIDGHRFRNSINCINEVGLALGRFHREVSSLSISCDYSGSFHDSELVRKRIATTANDDNFLPLPMLMHKLLDFYDSSAEAVNLLGIDQWEKQLTHGDWHPGNILFKDKTLVAVLDFDSIKYTDPICDLANACLQFTIVAGRANPKDWPAHLNVDGLVTLLNAYNQANPIVEDNKLLAIPDLMIETMIAEAILPIAATGYFAHFSGVNFIKMIIRKSDWIRKNKRALVKRITKALRNQDSKV